MRRSTSNGIPRAALRLESVGGGSLLRACRESGRRGAGDVVDLDIRHVKPLVAHGTHPGAGSVGRSLEGGARDLLLTSHRPTHGKERGHGKGGNGEFSVDVQDDSMLGWNVMNQVSEDAAVGGEHL